ncbi:UQCRC2 [Branchiostoma lanceolatum]|uniref:UQCRC2 protein n=1 Tax=Branchiostoma lanceolatum TaxID=7740 RepID=A0A8K0AFC3_BRALA|nr:UQCRC2 [Branchiostoma lanceolatum]
MLRRWYSTAPQVAMSLIEDLMREVNMLNDNKAKVAKEMKDIKDKLDKMDLTSLSDRISELESYQDKMKKIDQLEKQLAELAEQMKNLPTAEEFDAFVTWPVLDEALREERQKYMEVCTDHDTLVQLGEDLFSVSTGPPADKAPAKYVGGVDSRTHIPGPISTAAIVTEGSSLNSTDLLSLGVLQRLLGAGPYVKWGSDIASSRLNRGVAQATQMPFSTTCFNANYTDSGLFGLLATAPAEQMGTVLKAAVSQYGAITKGDVQDADVQRAKSQLKAAVLMSMEDSANVLEDLALQAVETAAYVSPDQVAAQVDSITTDQIVKVAKRVFNGKPTMASLGDLSSTPHLDQLV